MLTDGSDLSGGHVSRYRGVDPQMMCGQRRRAGSGLYAPGCFPCSLTTKAAFYIVVYGGACRERGEAYYHQLLFLPQHTWDFS